MEPGLYVPYRAVCGRKPGSSRAGVPRGHLAALLGPALLPESRVLLKDQMVRGGGRLRVGNAIDDLCWDWLDTACHWDISLRP